MVWGLDQQVIFRTDVDLTDFVARLARLAERGPSARDQQDRPSRGLGRRARATIG